MSVLIKKLYELQRRGDNPYYMLRIELDNPSDKQLQDCLTTLSRAAGVEGCCGLVDADPNWYEETSYTLESFASYKEIAGIIQLFDGSPVTAKSSLWRNEDRAFLQIRLCLGPLAYKNHKMHTLFFDRTKRRELFVWSQPLNDWALSVAKQIFAEYGFNLALLGFDLTATNANQLLGVAPEKRSFGYLFPESGSLRYEPANQLSTRLF